MTRKLDLRTGRPVWSAYRAPRVPTAALNRDILTDVLVVGMGVSGAMVAEALAADGRSVVVIDRRGALKGSTAATTALVAFEIDQPLSKLERTIGKERAARAWRRSYVAVANLHARIKELAIPCRMVTRNSLYLAGNVLDAPGLCTETQARRQIGLFAEYLPGTTLAERFGIVRDGAILSHHNLALDPRKMTAGLFRIAMQRGARFYAPVEAVGFEHHKNRVTVLTRGGPIITASHIVLATGYELTGVVPPVRHRILSTWAIATCPQKHALWPEDCFVWESSDPYLYIRTTADGRVICGGEDEYFVDEAERDLLIGEKSQRIGRRLKKLFPDIDAQPDFSWAGSFGTTSTGLPYIGKVPRHPRIHAVMGYGGNGITFSQIASEIIRSDLSGAPDIDADLFAFES